MYISIYQNELFPSGDKIATSAVVSTQGSKEMGTIEAIAKRIENRTLSMELCEKIVVLKSGPKEWKFGNSSLTLNSQHPRIP